MIELGTGQKAPAGGHVKDVTEREFMIEVVDASKEVPVIVHFWSPRAGQDALGKMLEEAVNAGKGAVRLAKVNVDQAQGIAAQLQIQAVPTVYAFWQGQPVDGFQGAVPQAEVKSFVDRLIAQGGGAPEGDGLAEALEAAEEMMEQGAAADAMQIFAAILGEDAGNAAAYGGVIRAYLAMGEVDQAEAYLNGAPLEISKAPELEAAHAQILLARQAENAGPVSELGARVDAEPDNHQARFDLALALSAKGDQEAAVEQLLELFRRDREWNEGAARTQLFTIFDALKPNDPIVLKGRRKLSSMVFV